jgi:NAD(P)-dependent dehydrogenase (short-subunit alcohol dehydrogenase family)
MTGRLDGKRVVVIGAGTRPSADPDAPPGNGRAIAIQASREGASVVCVDRDGDAARVTADLIGAEGGSASVLVADVTDEADCERILDVAEEPWGVVCNAGIGLGVGLSQTSAEQWDATMAVNLRGPFLIARAAVPKITAGGSIVFIGSVAGLLPGSRLPAYDASQAGHHGVGHPCRSVARVRRGRWPGPRRSCCRPRRRTSPVTRWWSTAGWRSCDPHPGSNMTCLVRIQ